MTIADSLRGATETLRAAGILGAAWDAELLLRHVLGWDRARLAAGMTEPLAPHAGTRFDALVAKRARRYPLQHLTGVQAFWRHEFLVTPDVLVPRPATEHLVESALELLRPLPAPLVADVGTGSGCIALSLAGELIEARLHATDISPAAIAVAEANALRLGLAARVRFHVGHLLDPLTALAGTLDLVVSNPPYVDPAEAATLEPEVARHEPASALFAAGGQYGAYEALCPQAARFLRPGGYCLLEVGRGMERRVAELCAAAALQVLDVRKDLQGIARVVLAQRAVPTAAPC